MDILLHSANFEVLETVYLCEGALVIVDVELRNDVFPYGRLHLFKKCIPIIRLSAPKRKGCRCGLHNAYNITMMNSAENLLECGVCPVTVNETVSRDSEILRSQKLQRRLSRQLIGL